MYKFMCGHIISPLLGTYLGVGFLGHTVILHLIFWEASQLFSIKTDASYITISSVQKLYLSTSL